MNVTKRRESHDFEADLSRFICRLGYVFSVYGVAPRGPYLPPREYIWRGDTPEWLYVEVRVATYEVPLPYAGMITRQGLLDQEH